MTIIMVTSRGPYSYEKKNGKEVRIDNAGGVATGLVKIVERYKGAWICWGDGSLDSAHLNEHNGKFTIHRIMLTSTERKGYYDKYSNSTLWPLFHYFREKVEHDENAFNIYRDVNRKFAQKVKNIAHPEDILWIHDYQLSLVPGFLREMGVKNVIIFSWHIPWVSSEFYTILPEREEIVRSIAESDSITFHTQKYRMNFCHSYERLFNHDRSAEKKTHAYPLGIDYKSFGRDMEIIRKRPFKEMKIIFSIDRLDYTKGLVERVNSIERFITEYPENRGKFVFLMMVTPSRAGVEEYDKLKERLEMNIGRINGLYGDLNWTPIVYMYRKITQEILKTYYSWGDIALITPMKDGLNLVAMEFVAVTNHGVLIISEFAGISEYLKGAVKTNPNSIDDMAEKINLSMSMERTEITKRLGTMKAFLRTHDDVWWTEKIIGTVKDIKR
jgi:Trehalose-6-phosphate synthase